MENKRRVKYFHVYLCELSKQKGIGKTESEQLVKSS